MEKFVETYLTSKKSEKLIILDIGSLDVNGSYKGLFTNPGWKYCGIDSSPGKNVDIVLSDPYSWKNIPSNYADVIISGQSFEHIEYIWLTMKEISRVLKPQGLACIIAPSSGPEHKYPMDCWRIYPDGFKALAKYSDLEIVEVFTQWENENYPDNSDIWHDSILICRKTREITSSSTLHCIWLKDLAGMILGKHK
ncbi:MAG: methyltransferase domain-containing protein [Methanoregula sp.]|jgi:SAM-dependent methyltransferase